MWNAGFTMLVYPECIFFFERLPNSQGKTNWHKHCRCFWTVQPTKWSPTHPFLWPSFKGLLCLLGTLLPDHVGYQILVAHGIVNLLPLSTSSVDTEKMSLEKMSTSWYRNPLGKKHGGQKKNTKVKRMFISGPMLVFFLWSKSTPIKQINSPLTKLHRIAEGHSTRTAGTVMSKPTAPTTASHSCSGWSPQYWLPGPLLENNLKFHLVKSTNLLIELTTLPASQKKTTSKRSQVPTLWAEGFFGKL